MTKIIQKVRTLACRLEIIEIIVQHVIKKYSVYVSNATKCVVYL